MQLDTGSHVQGGVAAVVTRGKCGRTEITELVALHAAAREQIGLNRNDSRDWVEYQVADNVGERCGARAGARVRSDIGGTAVIDVRAQPERDQRHAQLGS